MSTKSTVGYFIEPEDVNKLHGIKDALYGDGTHLTPDTRRDLANKLDYLLSVRLIPLTDNDITNF